MQFLHKSEVFQNSPKSCQSFGLLLLEILLPRTLKNRQIWSHCGLGRRIKNAFCFFLCQEYLRRRRRRHHHLRAQMQNPIWVIFWRWLRRQRWLFVKQQFFKFLQYVRTHGSDTQLGLNTFGIKGFALLSIDSFLTFQDVEPGFQEGLIATA